MKRLSLLSGGERSLVAVAFLVDEAAVAAAVLAQAGRVAVALLADAGAAADVVEERIDLQAGADRIVGAGVARRNAEAERTAGMGGCDSAGSDGSGNHCGEESTDSGAVHLCLQFRIESDGRWRPWKRD